jgi:hypothetical protein
MSMVLETSKNNTIASIFVILYEWMRRRARPHARTRARASPMERFFEIGAAPPDYHTNIQTWFIQKDINRIDVT